MKTVSGIGGEWWSQKANSCKFLAAIIKNKMPGSD